MMPCRQAVLNRFVQGGRSVTPLGFQFPDMRTGARGSSRMILCWVRDFLPITNTAGGFFSNRRLVTGITKLNTAYTHKPSWHQSRKPEATHGCPAIPNTYKTILVYRTRIIRDCLIEPYKSTKHCRLHDSFQSLSVIPFSRTGYVSVIASLVCCYFRRPCIQTLHQN